MGYIQKENSPPSKSEYTQSTNYDIFFNHLRRIAQLCNEHQIRFIAITPPAADIYLTHITPEGINRIDYIIKNIQKDYPIEYKNYLSDSAFRSDSLYFDATHHNHRGATLFAQRIREDFNL